jgi:VWFA-related protein
MCGRKTSTAGPADYEARFPMVRSAAADIDAARRRRTALTLQAMRRASGARAPFGGRRSILFLSPGFLQDEDLSQQDVASAAFQAHTAVYFVDVRGLLTRGPAASVTNDLQSPERPSQRVQREMERRNVENGGALALAEETGGVSLRNTNDLAGAAARIAAEARTFYLLGFHPPAGKRADTWRKLRVTVSRSGVTVRARRGYRLDAARSSSTRLRWASSSPIA